MPKKYEVVIYRSGEPVPTYSGSGLRILRSSRFGIVATAWNWVLEKLIAVSIGKKLPALYSTKTFSAMPTRVRHWTLVPYPEPHEWSWRHLIMSLLRSALISMYLTASPLFTLQFAGRWLQLFPGSVVMFSVLPTWNGVSLLSFRKKRLNPQNKYLITVNNNNK
jgi:hypothetical protein